MLCVFKVHEAFSGNKDLNNPRQIVNGKLDFYTAQSINILPLNENAKVALKTRSSTKRPVIRGMRSRFSKSLINTTTSKEKRCRQRSSRLTTEVSTGKVKKMVAGENGINLTERAVGRTIEVEGKRSGEQLPHTRHIEENDPREMDIDKGILVEVKEPTPVVDTNEGGEVGDVQISYDKHQQVVSYKGIERWRWRNGLNLRFRENRKKLTYYRTRQHFEELLREIANDFQIKEEVFPFPEELRNFIFDAMNWTFGD